MPPFISCLAALGIFLMLGSAAYAIPDGEGNYILPYNVGIGSSVPQQKLDVEGTVYFGSGNVGIGTAAPVAGLDVNSTIYGHSNVGIGTAAARALLDVEGSVYMRGNVGIGTSAPAAALDVNGRLNLSGSGDSVFYGNVGIGSATPSRQLDVLGDINFSGSIYQNGSLFTGSQWVGTVGNPIYYNSGNVGIGTTSPSAALDVNGRLNISGSGDSVFYGNLGVGSASPQAKLDVEGVVYVGSGGNIGIGTSLPRAGLQVGSGAGSLGAPLNGTAALIKGNLEVDGKIYGDGSGLTNIISSQWTTVGSNIYYNSGNVGIGTAQPAAKLDVDGAVYLKGNVGIGTSSPGNLLTVVGSSGGASDFYPVRISASVNSPGGVGLMIDNTVGPTNMNAFWDFASQGTAMWSAGMDLRANGTSDFFVYEHAASTARLYINSSGNVGIGTTEPAGLLDVNRKLTVLSGGNVGIGSAIPQQKLEVEGGIYVGSGGNIGIGSVSPAAGLQVGSGAGALAGIPLNGNSALVKGNLEVDGKIYGDGSGLTGVVGSISGLTTNYLAKASNSTTIINSQIFDNGVNIGIGSASPQQKLDVEGSAYFGSGNVGIGTAALAVAKLAVSEQSSGDNVPAVFIQHGSDLTSAMYREGLMVGEGLAMGDDIVAVWADGANHGGFIQAARVFDSWRPLTLNPNGGNVGIGSVQPGANLDVNGTIYGHGNVGIGTAAARSLLDVEGAVYLRGNVGVGTTDPGYILDVADYSRFQRGATFYGNNNAIVLSTYGGTTYGYISLGAGGVSGIGMRSDANSGGNAYLFGSSDSGIVVNSTGNVGIGSATPQRKLDVEGTVYVGSGGNVGIGTVSPAAGLQVGSGTSSLGATLNGTAALVKGNLEVDGKIYGDGSGLTGISGVTGWTVSGSDVYKTSSSGNVGIGSSSPQQKLDVEGAVYFGTGNVGINSASPAARLDVEGTIYGHSNVGIGTASSRALLDVNGSVYMRGNVGIGTTSPQAKLDVFYPTTGDVIFSQTTGDGGSDMNLRIGYNGYGWYWKYLGSGSGDNNELQLWSEGAGSTDQQAYGIKQSGITTFYKNVSFNGNVGINSSSPLQRLDVEGTIYIGTGGNLGIGTASPGYRLSIVDGNIDFSASAYANSFINRVYGMRFNWANDQSYGRGYYHGIFSTDSTGTASDDLRMGSYGDLTFVLDDNNNDATSYFRIGHHAAANASIGTPLFVVASPTGNVGIGSAVPRQKLDVEGTVYVGSSGNIGIGTALPVAGLQVGTGASALGATLSGTGALIRGNLEVDGRIYGDGSGLTNMANLTGWTVSGSNVYKTSSSGNVGIGTSSPQAKLDVEGTVYFGSGNVGVGTYLPQATMEVMRTGSVAPFMVSSTVNGDYLMVTSSGNVGIGSTTPNVKLQVNGSAIIKGSSTSGIEGEMVYDSGGHYYKYYNGSTWEQFVGGSVTYTGTLWDQNGTTIYYTAGNVGIGTNAPGQLLDIWQMEDSNGLRIRGFDDQSGSYVDVSVTSGGDILYWANSEMDFMISGNTNFIADATRFTHYLNTRLDDNVVLLAGIDSDYALGYNSADDTFRIADGSNLTGTPRLVLDANGNIGLNGETTPDATLEVAGTTGRAPLMVSNGAAGDGNFLIVTSAGNVGINSSTPIARLDIIGPATGGGQTLHVGGGGDMVLGSGGSLFFDNNYSYASGSYIRPTAANTQTFVTSGVERMRITSAGNIGISSSAPQQRLDVEGTVYFGTGNVGIGTPSPAYALEVSRSIPDSGYNGLRLTNTASSANGYPMVDFYNTNSGGFSSSRIYSQVGGGYTDARMYFAVADSARALQTRMVINVSGNVGIGDTTPDSFLDMLSNTAANTYFKITNNNAGDYDPAIQFELTENTPLFTVGVDDSDSDKFKISTTALGTNDRLVITSTGNVGISSSSPQQILDVEGTVYVGSSGNIGIGTSSPRAGLQVGSGTAALGATLNGTGALIKGNLEVDGKIYGDGSGLSNVVGSISGLAINYLTKASTATTIVNSQIFDNGTNVGIGSTSPRQKLDVEGTVYFGSGNVGVGDASPDSLLDMLSSAASNTYMKMTNTNAGDYDPAVQFELAEGTPLFTVGVDDSDADKFKISTTALGTNDRLVITSAGNVGIGSSSPQQKLDVEGAVYFGSGNVGVGDATPDSLLDMLSAAAADTYIKMTNTNAGDYDAAVQFELAEGTPSFTIGVDDSDADKFKISTTALGTNDRLVITSAGNVGIGSSSPQQRLDVEGTAYFGSGNVGIGTVTPVGLLDVRRSLTVLSGGNVGIGSVTPQTKLDVEGTVYFGSGNVGVGTSLPQASLEVLRTGSVPPLMVSSTVNGDLLMVTSSGNVGIGTTTPNVKLQVNGSAIIKGSSTTGIEGEMVYDSGGHYYKYFNGTTWEQFVGGSVTYTGTLWDQNGTTIYYDAGNVGIGTDAPGQVLDIWQMEDSNGLRVRGFDDQSGSYGDISITSGGDMLYWSNSEMDFVISGNTNFIADATRFTHYLNARLDDNVVLLAGIDSDYALGYNSADDTFRIADGANLTGAPRLVMNANGNIGLNGETSPDATLEVAVAGGRVPLMVSNGAAGDGNFLIVTSAGNVGIGSTSPQRKLDVEGTVYFGSGNVGIGTVSPNSTLHLNGSFAVYRTSSAGGTTAGQVIIGVDSSGGAHTITLASADCVAGRIIIIKDEAGSAGTNNITIATEGSEDIDGTSDDNSVLITSNYGVVRVYSNGSDWFTF